MCSPSSLKLVETQPRPPPKLGTVGPRSRCFGRSRLRYRTINLEEEGIANTWKALPSFKQFSRAEVSPDIPQIKKWQLAGFFNHGPCTTLSPRHFTSTLYLSIFFLSLLLHFIIFLRAVALSPSLLLFLPPLAFPEKHISIWHRK